MRNNLNYHRFYFADPCLVVSKIITKKVQEKAYKLINYLLQKPDLSISIVLIAIIFIMIAITISFMAMAGITCLAVFIIVVESMNYYFYYINISNVLCIKIMNT